MDFELFEDDVNLDFKLPGFNFESDDLECDEILDLSLSFNEEERLFCSVPSLSLVLFAEGDSFGELLENRAVASLLLDVEGLDKTLHFCSASFEGFAEEEEREECFSVERLRCLSDELR